VAATSIDGRGASGINAWRNNAGADRRLRHLLLGSVALSGLLLAGAPRRAYAQQNDGCVVTGDTADCAPTDGSFIGYPYGADAPTNLIVRNGFDALPQYNAVELRNYDSITITVDADTAPVIASNKYGSVVGVRGQSDYGVATIESNNNIEASSKYSAVGIEAAGGTGAVVNSTGTVSVSSPDQPFGSSYSSLAGIVASTYIGNVEVSATGDIEAVGGLSSNVSGISNVVGADALGINAVSINGGVLINSTGDITATGGSVGGTYAGDNLRGGDATGIIARTFGAGASVLNDGVIAATGGSVAVGRNYSSGGSAQGIVVRAGDEALIVNSGAVTAVGGDIGGINIYNASYSNAIGLAATGSAGAFVRNTGDVTATGGLSSYGRSAATGISAFSDAGDVTVENTGDITVSSDVFFGKIGSTYFSSGGISAFGGKGTASVSVTNTGTIAINGAGTGIYGYGGEIRSVDNQGDITITGSDVNFGGAGILLDGGYGENYVLNSGNITVDNSETGADATFTGKRQAGIDVTTRFQDATSSISTIVNSGDVTVRARGKYAYLDALDARGISAESQGSTITIVNSGAVDVSSVGDAPDTALPSVLGLSGYSEAVNVQDPDTGFSTYLGGGDVSITTTGDVTVTAGPTVDALYGNRNLYSNSAAIQAVSVGGNAYDAGATSILVDGATVTANGDTVVGIFASGSANTVTVANGGEVRNTGAGASAVVVGPQYAETIAREEYNYYNSYTSETEVRTRSVYVDVLVSSTNQVTITEGSSVVSEQGTAIEDLETFTFGSAGLSAAPISLKAAAPFETDPDTGIESATVPNTTTVEAFGTVTGGGGTAIALNGGDDTVIVGPRAAITGLVDGGEGDETDGDALALGGTGTGSFDFGLVDGDGFRDANDQYLNFENFRKEGSSTFAVTGTNGEIFSLPVLNGTLLANGSLVNADLPISGGATLGGIGTVGSFTAMSGATVAPGAPGADRFATLSTTGDATFELGSTFQVALNDAGQNSSLNVGGTTTIEGGTVRVVVDPGAFAEARTYTVINSPGGVTGEFTGVVDNLPDIDFADTYDGASVKLSFTVPEQPEEPEQPTEPEEPGPLQPQPEQPTQPQPTPSQPDNNAFSRKENGLAAVFGANDAAINFAETLARRAGLSNMAAMQGGTLMAYAAPATIGSNAVAAIGSTTTPGGLGEGGVVGWVGAFGTTSTVDANGNAFGYDTRSGGLAGGFEYRMQDDVSSTLVGVAAGYSRTNVDVVDGGATVETGHLGVYGAYLQGPLSVNGALAYSRSGYDLDRTIRFGIGSLDATADASGNAWSGFTEASYDVASLAGVSDFSFGPAVRFRGATAGRDAYTETGAGVFNLAVGEDSVSQYFGAIGVKASTTVDMNGVVLKPEFELFYERNFTNAASTSDAVLVATGGTFSTAVSAAGSDRIAVGLGLGAAISETVDAHVRYDGSFGSNVQSSRASIGFSVKF